MKLSYCLLVLLMSFTVNVYAKPIQNIPSDEEETAPSDALIISVDVDEEELEEEHDAMSETEKAYKERHHN